MTTPYQISVQEMTMNLAFEKAKDKNPPLFNVKTFVDMTSFAKASGLSPEGFFKTLNVSDTVVAYGVCLTEPVANTNAVKVKVEEQLFKGTRQWDLFYCLYDDITNELMDLEELKAKALGTAKDIAVSRKTTVRIDLERRLNGSDKLIAKVSYNASAGETSGTYMFFGMGVEIETSDILKLGGGILQAISEIKPIEVKLSETSETPVTESPNPLSALKGSSITAVKPAAQAEEVPKWINDILPEPVTPTAPLITGTQGMAPVVDFSSVDFSS